MAARIWTKQQTQETIRALRKAGYTVAQKTQGFYNCDAEVDGIVKSVFTAARGQHGYMVRYDDRLIQEEG